jgi:hypothetical protein
MGQIKYAGGKFFQIPDELVNQFCPKLKRSSFVFLVALLKLENKLGNSFYHSDEQMKREFGFSESNCKRARKELRATDLIGYTVKWDKEKTRFKAGEYFIFPKDEIKEIMNVIADLELSRESKIAQKTEKDDNEAEIEEIWEFYQGKIGKNYRFTLLPKVKNHIGERLKSFSQDELKTAIENFCNDSWRMEYNAYFGPTWFFKSDEQIQMFLNLRPEEQMDPAIRRLKELTEKPQNGENDKKT